MKIDIINYSDLSKDQLFELIKLRINVFVVEQNCPYQELDEIDLISNHVIGSNNNQILALGRLYKKEDSIHIGRIAVKKEFRNLGYARELMQESAIGIPIGDLKLLLIFTWEKIGLEKNKIKIRVRTLILKCI